MMNLRIHSILALVLTLLAASAYATHIDLGTASMFGMVKGSGTVNTGSSVVHGDVCSSSTPATHRETASYASLTLTIGGLCQ